MLSTYAIVLWGWMWKSPHKIPHSWMRWGGTTRLAFSRQSWAVKMPIRQIAVTTLLLMLAGVSLADSPTSIPGNITHVANGRSLFGARWSDHRLVITGVCSPEHCFSRGRIEWVKGSIPGESTVAQVSEVAELDSVLLVRAIRFVPMVEDEPAKYEIEAVNSSTSEGGQLTLTVVGVGAYKATLSGDPLGPPQ